MRFSSHNFCIRRSDMPPFLRSGFHGNIVHIINFLSPKQYISIIYGLTNNSKFALHKKYRDKDPSANKLLTQNVRIGLDGKKHPRNLNILVCGGSGAGKTRFFCKPNAMQCNTSFVVLDPKGSQSQDPFWDTAASMLFLALVFYLKYEAPPYERNALSTYAPFCVIIMTTL